MNNRLAILFAMLCILVFFGSCQKRYGYVKKVKTGHKQSVQHKHARYKSPPQQPYFTLENKKAAIAEHSYADSFLVDITPAVSQKQPAPRKKRRNSNLQSQHIIAENDSPGDNYAPHPDIEDVKLGSSNLNEVANVSLIIGLVLLLLGLLFLLGVFVASGFMAASFFAAENIVLASLGVLLIYPVIWLISKLYKDLQNDTVTYGGKSYPLKDVKHMPGQIQVKRAWHNFLAALALTALGSLLFLFGFVFLPGVIWYFLKLLHALFFIERF